MLSPEKKEIRVHFLYLNLFDHHKVQFQLPQRGSDIGKPTEKPPLSQPKGQATDEIQYIQRPKQCDKVQMVHIIYILSVTESSHNLSLLLHPFKTDNSASFIFSNAILFNTAKLHYPTLEDVKSAKSSTSYLQQSFH